MWIPAIVVSYPGLSTGDTLDELSQFFHRNTSWSIESINLLNEDVYINKHHSVFHTVIMGLIYKLGRNLLSFTFGAFMYTFLQVIVLLIVFAFMIKYMKRIKINNLIIILSILFVGLNPTIVTYSICAIKDTPSAIVNVLYVIFLLQVVRNFDSIFNSKLRMFVFLMVILLVLLLRNNGIYTFLLSFPCLFFVYKQKWKKILLMLLVPIMIYGIYDKVILPSYDVSDGSIREVLSIPVMQLARVINHKPDVFSDKDIEIIDKIFDFDTMNVVYDPNCSDDVKNLYNKDATFEDIKDFFGVWFKYLKKYPLIYVDSIFNSTYGYFFPEMSQDELYLYNYKFFDTSYFDIESLSAFKHVRDLLNKLISIYYRLPFFINKVAYYDWFLIFSFGYIVSKKKYKYLIPMMPLCAVLLMCLASPLNGSFRYILPIVFSAPIIASIDYLVYKECRENNK